MAYDVRDLHGAWTNIDDDSLLKLEEDGNFKLTPPDDSPETADRWSDMVNSISGKWTIEDGKFKLSVDLRSMRFSPHSRFMAIGLAIFSFLLRFVKEKEIVNGKIMQLTATDLWIEDSQGGVTKFQKKLGSRQ